MDCYSVHISADFLTWAKRTYPNLILLFIPATFTAWLQPLDISFDWVFKAFLCCAAARWLSSYVAEKLRLDQDPTKVRLDVCLTTIRPLPCDWAAEALREMSKHQDVINRGWKESRMGDAFGLIHEGRERAEFLKAKELDERGELFASFTAKKNV